MKKYIFAFILFATSAICFAQDTDMKHYSDYSQGFDGWAMSEYIDDVKKEDVIGNEAELLDYMDEEVSAVLTPIPKLTKKNTWLFKQALNEWDYEPGEVYLVLCTESQYAKNGIAIFTIIKGKNDYLWRAYSISDNDLDKILQ